jgi:predicted DsbA family dithiol-disulfide isomerase
MIRLDIISDVACPWCYVGKAYLDRALQARPDHPMLIEWHPYQLNPDLPDEGMDRGEYMSAKFGSRENVIAFHKTLLEHAEKAGVDFNLPAVKRAPNTLNANRLIHWAGLEGRQTAMKSALLNAYWCDGRDIGCTTTLADIAAEIGLERDIMERLLQSNADREEIAARSAHARARGVNSVPTFIVANRHALQGAQPTEIWLNVIDELSAKLKADDQ